MNSSLPDLRNAMLAAIVDSSDDAIISKDLNGTITSWNAAAERVFGYTSQEATGRSIMMLLPPGREHEEMEIISKIRAGIRLDHFETVRVTKSGQLLDVSLTVSPIYINDEIIGASKIARDITLQKETAALILEHADHLEIINDISQAIVYELNVENVVHKVISATTKICRADCSIFLYNVRDEKEVSSIRYDKIGISTKKVNAGFNIEQLTKLFGEKGTFRTSEPNSLGEMEVEFIEGLFREENMSIRSCMGIPLFSKSGAVNGGLFFGHHEKNVFKEEHEKLIESISSQTAVAIENASLYEEIKKLNARKDEFIGFASHELKTPLTTIKGYVQLAMAAPEHTAAFLPKINKQVERLSAIIGDLLDITRIDSGNLDLSFSPVLLSALIGDSIESVQPIASAHHIINHPIQEDVSVIVDAQKMEQVLINILTNAVKYSPQHTAISIQASRIDDEILVSISDEGVGISDEHAYKIFNLFYRIEETPGAAKGQGIGLYLSQQIMTGHRGKIWVESKKGEGSVFYVQFPIDASS